MQRNLGWANHFEQLESTAALAKIAGMEAEFDGWADQAQLSSQSRSNLAWIRGDLAGTLAALTETAKSRTGI